MQCLTSQEMYHDHIELAHVLVCIYLSSATEAILKLVLGCKREHWVIRHGYDAYFPDNMFVKKYRNRLKVSVPMMSANTFFTNRIVDLCNSLRNEVVPVQSLQAFTYKVSHLNL